MHGQFRCIKLKKGINDMEKMYETDDETVIDLHEIFYALRSKMWMIILAFIMGGAGAGIYSNVILTPMYSSTAMVYILSKETTLTSLADLQIGSQLAKDYRVVTTSRPVMQEVIDSLNLGMKYEELKRTITLENPSDTRILSITVENPDPVLAKTIVDQVAKVSSEHIGDIMEMTPPKIIENGVVAEEKIGPNVKKNGLIGAFGAALVVWGLIISKVVLNDTIKTEADVEKYLQMSVLSSIPVRKDERKKVKLISGYGKGNSKTG